MAETPSQMIPLGTKAPNFILPDTITGKNLSLSELPSDKATVITFICNHCPYVKLIMSKLIETANEYQKKGIRFISICSNDSLNYPQDAPDKMREEALKQHFPFPYLHDATQEVAKAYHAACTPDFFVFDKKLYCVYRGRFDEATPGNGKSVTGYDLCQALDNILANKPINPNQFPSVGCNIKWKK
ncbi:MAG: anti-oxidant AhpCTSA family protein [uncultured bacterium]|nr:MAG: anti-oxidant AhpCTSA family protein [uncultured bacterium]